MTKSQNKNVILDVLIFYLDQIFKKYLKVLLKLIVKII